MHVFVHIYIYVYLNLCMFKYGLHIIQLLHAPRFLHATLKKTRSSREGVPARNGAS